MLVDEKKVLVIRQTAKLCVLYRFRRVDRKKEERRKSDCRKWQINRFISTTDAFAGVSMLALLANLLSPVDNLASERERCTVSESETD